MEYTAGAGAPRYGGTARWCAEVEADGVRGATWCRHRFVAALARRSAPPCSPPCASPPTSAACTCTAFGLWSLTFGLRAAPPNPLTLGVEAMGEPGARCRSLCSAASWKANSPAPRRMCGTAAGGAIPAPIWHLGGSWYSLAGRVSKQ